MSTALLFYVLNAHMKLQWGRLMWYDSNNNDNTDLKHWWGYLACDRTATLVGPDFCFWLLFLSARHTRALSYSSAEHACFHLFCTGGDFCHIKIDLDKRNICWLCTKCSLMWQWHWLGNRCVNLPATNGKTKASRICSPCSLSSHLCIISNFIWTNAKDNKMQEPE